MPEWVIVAIICIALGVFALAFAGLEHIIPKEWFDGDQTD